VNKKPERFEYEKPEAVSKGVKIKTISKVVNF